jgi:phosphoribosylglycinamide formyltransferase-1
VSPLPDGSALRVTVLISGSGTNLQSLIDAVDLGRLDVELVHVISNRAEARGLQRASQAGIPSSILPHGNFASRDEFDSALALLMAAHSPGLIVLAGFMRILGPAVIQEFSGKMINLHPSLLPLYRGTDTYQRAILAGDREHGASIHFVTGELDGGPVISQVRIPVEPGDTPEQLATRLSPREHALMVSTVELFSQGLITCNDEHVSYDGRPLKQPLILQTDGSFLD